MNRVYLGANSIGFESAAQRYFGKSATAVSLQEAAMLAALLTAPSRYTPVHNLKLAQERSKLVIGLMLEQRYITAEEATIAMAFPANALPTGPNKIINLDIFDEK